MWGPEYAQILVPFAPALLSLSPRGRMCNARTLLQQFPHGSRYLLLRGIVSWSRSDLIPSGSLLSNSLCPGTVPSFGSDSLICGGWTLDTLYGTAALSPAENASDPDGNLVAPGSFIVLNSAAKITFSPAKISGPGRKCGIERSSVTTNISGRKFVGNAPRAPSPRTSNTPDPEGNVHITQTPNG